MKLSELALLKIMHQRISPNTMGMEHYSRAFSAFLLIERGNVRDLCKLTGLDPQSVSHLLKNLEKTSIIRSLRGKTGEFIINLEAEKLLELVEKNEKKEFSWTTTRNKKQPKRDANERVLSLSTLPFLKVEGRSNMSDYP